MVGAKVGRGLMLFHQFTEGEYNFRRVLTRFLSEASIREPGKLPILGILAQLLTCYRRPAR